MSTQPGDSIQKDTEKTQQEKLLSHDDYTVGWICALSIELAASQVMRDEKHGQINLAEGDTNSYLLGRVAAHNVVMACLPQGSTGTNAAATAAVNMTRTFPQLRFLLLVGVGGGAPNPDSTDAESDLHLGDVVVSKPSLETGGVFQYDFVKNLQSEAPQNGKVLNKPPSILRTAVARLEALHITDGSNVKDILQQAYQCYPRLKKMFGCPGTEQDILYAAEYEHEKGKQDCSSCQVQQIVKRNPRDDLSPVIHYGVVASANQVMRNALIREKMRRKLGVICFEMEAAGLMDDCPCLVIRGICDYADSHKNKQWQPYAALTAAAYAKELLQSMEAHSIRNESIVQLTDLLQDQIKVAREQAEITREYHRKQDVHYQDEQHRNCHRVFKTSDYEGEKNINPDAVPRTCRWVLDHSQYQNWLTSTKDDLLWISADPGCGKSVLSKLLVDKHLRQTNNVIPHTICYYFFKDNERQNSISTALCAILHQLFGDQPDLISHALPAFDRNGEKLQRDTNELWRILRSAASDATARPVICVFDALDECRDTDRAQLIDFFCQTYQYSRATPTDSYLKLLATSRPYDNVRDRFERIPADLPSIRLRGEDESDQIRSEINLVILERVQELSREVRLSAGKTEEIQQQLLSMEHRTYLWLYLAMDAVRNSFRDAVRPSDQEIILVPASVEEAYERILARVNGSQRKQAKAILMIIIGARRPLTVEEMALALDISTLGQTPSALFELTIDASLLSERIRRWCGLFVLVSGGRLYLLHQTAKEFLLKPNNELMAEDSSWKHCLPLLEIEKQLATICIKYLHLSDFNKPRSRRKVRDRSKVGTFFKYACKNWASHAQPIEEYLDEETREIMENLYDESAPRWKRWTSTMWQVSGYNNENFGMNNVQLASYNGHSLLVQNLLCKSAVDVNSTDNKGNTSLLLASQQGFDKVVQVLLNRNANVNAQGEFFGTSLQAASFFGHRKVVQMLLDIGANVNAQGGYFGTALQAASYHGHRKVVQILLDRNADVNIQGGKHGNALCSASYLGHDEVVQLLLDRNANVNTQGRGGLVNALQVATFGGHEKVVQLLLDAGADVNAQGGKYGNALQAASAYGNDRVVQMLLDRSADVNAQGGFFGAALQAASVYGHDRVVQMLLDVGANVNAQGGYFGTALHAASANGHDKVVQMLLDVGANVNVQGKRHGTALQAASCGGFEKVVQMLLDRNADVNAQGGKYGNALQAATAGGHDKVVQMLNGAKSD